MKSRHEASTPLCPPLVRGEERGFGDKGGSILAALAMVLLIFAITTAGLIAVVTEHAGASGAHRGAVAFALAEAGLAQAVHELAADSAYSGGRGELQTGEFITRNTPGRGPSRVVIISEGFASAPGRIVRRSVEAEIDVSSPRSPRLIYWREP